MYGSVGGGTTETRSPFVVVQGCSILELFPHKRSLAECNHQLSKRTQTRQQTKWILDVIRMLWMIKVIPGITAFRPLCTFRHKLSLASIWFLSSAATLTVSGGNKSVQYSKGRIRFWLLLFKPTQISGRHLWWAYWWRYTLCFTTPKAYLNYI